jgi:hypothetical protein
MDIHLVHPHNHHVNAAKHAIATFKEHFIAGLAMVGRNYPLQLWDKFLYQVELMLNLLHLSHHSPGKSANEEVNGPYDLNKTPIVPIITKSLVYDDPAVRTSWAPYGTDAFYIGPAPKHYCCLQFYIPTSQ